MYSVVGAKSDVRVSYVCVIFAFDALQWSINILSAFSNFGKKQLFGIKIIWEKKLNVF